MKYLTKTAIGTAFMTAMLPIIARAVGAGVPAGAPAEGSVSRGIADATDTIINYLIPIASAIVVVFVIAAAIIYLGSGGDAEKMKKGHMFLVGAAVGLVIIFLIRPIAGIICAIATGAGCPLPS